MFGVRILGILCAARVRGEITPHRRYRGVFPDSRFGKGRGLVRPRLSGAQPNQPLHLTAAALRFSVFNVSPAAAAGEGCRSLHMRFLRLSLLVLLAVSSACAGEKLMPPVVQLPRPNSGTFSFKQAEARKSEILSNTPTPKLENWKNPYMGFCVHVGKDDSLTVYGHWMKEIPEYRKPRAAQSAADIKKLKDELPLEGNPAGVLITSGLPLKDSKAIHEVLKVLFIPSVQLFYARSSEPDCAANRSQPVSSDTNQASAAAGSGR